MSDNVAKQMLDAVQVERAARLRASGAHWREVADQCGYSSPAAALKAVGAAMAEATMRAEVTADQLRDEATMRLESLLRDAMSMIEAETFYGEAGQALDDRPVRLRAIDESRRLVESLAKLHGVDKPAETAEQAGPSRVEVVGINPADLV